MNSHLDQQHLDVNPSPKLPGIHRKIIIVCGDHISTHRLKTIPKGPGFTRQDIADMVRTGILRITDAKISGLPVYQWEANDGLRSQSRPGSCSYP